MDSNSAEPFFPSGPSTRQSLDTQVPRAQQPPFPGAGALPRLTPVSKLNSRKKPRRGPETAAQKRRCVSTACIACRKRKSKCDGAVPSCAACSSVYGTECIYDPNSDHRRKGVYRDRGDSDKTRSATYQILIEAIINASEDQVPSIIHRIRASDNLDQLADSIVKNELDNDPETSQDQLNDEYTTEQLPDEGERELAIKMGELRLENGALRFIGGTSHLIYLGDPNLELNKGFNSDGYSSDEDSVTSWTRVSKNVQLINHLLNMYFTYHYAYFTTLSKKLFWRDYSRGRSNSAAQGTVYCSPLLVNAMLALGCHFTDVPGAYGIPGDNRTKGDHFFAEAKRLIVENDEYEKPRLVTVQALALMSVREAGCGREAKGWVYSGMSFRMAQDIGLNLEIASSERDCISDEDVDARKITFWGCFLFDKCWSNYLGRLPQIPEGSYTVSKIDVFPDEDAEPWAHLTDNGVDASTQQPSRARAIALQLSKLCEISSDLLIFFYHPAHMRLTKSNGKFSELKKLGELHQRLEEWHKDMPKELEPKEGQMPNVILMHMFFHLQYIHLFRPFLKYAPSASPLPSHVSPRRICTTNAGAISKLMRLYKKTWGLRQICNIAVYMVHSACTIHLLNLPEKNAKRDITHGVRHLEEIAEDWLCARRTLSIISVLARKWKCVLPEEAASVLQRADEKYGSYSTSEVPSEVHSPQSISTVSSVVSDNGVVPRQQKQASPLTQYSQAGMYHANSRTTVDDMAGAMSLQVPNGTGFVQQPLTGSMDGGSLHFNTDLMGDWVQPAATVTTMPTYHQPMLSAMSSSRTSDPSSSNSRRAKPNPPVETQDWLFSDSARWQQGFEGWEQSTHPGNGIFTFGGEPGSATDGREESSGQLSGFEDLGASFGNTGWLPGLD
ncbi:fungal-specific transcription factor domain-containing protein [Stachybotrys elegans]|uniref:Fungal-specific transcription factor domain-containing protein n=1 Tax=Stachybotrys elegans TaxID=80388 RepID=A0A8K0SZV5_9HYPO|nr:fungal-specific transcription factor domain-containing protein [Stachybotrys elegans]